MSLQLILGNSGSGKSTLSYKEVIDKSMKHMDTNYIIIVPEQFTMSTQQELVRLHPNKVIMNIDVLSFERLAHRVFDEIGEAKLNILDDLGKSLILKKLADDKKDSFGVLKGKINRIGYIGEVKSFISELIQYQVNIEDLENIIANDGFSDALRYKLKDIVTIYKAYKSYLEEDYVSSEELLYVLSTIIGESELIKNSVIVLDGYTGFTPVQYVLIKELLRFSKKLMVNLTIDANDLNTGIIKEQELFRLSKETIRKLESIAGELGAVIEDRIILGQSGNFRLQSAPDIAFLEQNIFRYSQNKTDIKPENITIFAGANPKDELENVAKRISVLVREDGYRYKDICLVTGDVETYGRLAQEVFARYEIPVFVDTRRSVLDNAFVDAVRALIEMIDRDFSYESVFRYLKSGLADMGAEDVDILENYCIAYGKRGFSAWKKEWIGKKNYSDELLEHVNKCRAAFADERMTEFVRVMALKSSTVAEKSRALYEFILEMDMQNRLLKMEQELNEMGRPDKAKEYSLIYKAVMDSLDEIVSLLGNEVMNIREFGELVDVAFGEIRVGLIPPGLDIVTVGDIERSRQSHIKVLFFVGVNDGIVPKTGNSAGIISERERDIISKEIDLAPGTRQKAFSQRLYLYMILTKPSDKLIISYSLTDMKQKAVRPSYLVGEISGLFVDGIEVQTGDYTKEGYPVFSKENAFNELVGLLDEFADEKAIKEMKLYQAIGEDEAFRMVFDKCLREAVLGNTAKTLSVESAAKLYGEVMRISITKLENYNKCAYKYFLQYGLSLRPREEYGFEAVNWGNVVHEVIEKITKLICDNGGDWESFDWSDIRKKADELLDETISDVEYDILKEDARQSYTIERLRRLLDISFATLRMHMKAGSFKTYACEKEFKRSETILANNRNYRMLVEGRVDRIDICEDEKDVYVKIIDYKTSAKTLNLYEVYHGLSLQLPVYAGEVNRIIKDQYKKNAKSAGVYYYGAVNPTADARTTDSEEVVLEKRMKELALKGYCPEDEKILEKLDKNLSKMLKIYPFATKKDGGLDSRSKTLDDASIEKLITYSRGKVIETGTRILEGEILAEPFKQKDKTGCDYCDFGSICRFNGNEKGCNYRHYEEMQDDAVLELMSEVVDKWGKTDDE